MIVSQNKGYVLFVAIKRMENLYLLNKCLLWFLSITLNFRILYCKRCYGPVKSHRISARVLFHICGSLT